MNRPIAAGARELAPAGSPALAATLLAFAAIYLIWGSTFLAIRLAVETIPPLTMIGLRSVLAGAVLLLAARLWGVPWPPAAAWRNAALAGALFFLAGHGALAWAERRIPSGLAAVLLAAIPLWVALLAWPLEGRRPAARTVIGLLIGFLGVAILMGGAAGGLGRGAPALDPLGAAATLFGAAAWALGTLVARRRPTLAGTRGGAAAASLAAGMQLVLGGALALAAGALGDEWRGFALAAVSPASWFGLTYLVLFGSLVAFGAFSWLNTHQDPARVATYAYVNPLVALLLGHFAAGEPLGPRTLAATAIILAGVAIVMARRRGRGS